MSDPTLRIVQSEELDIYLGDGGFVQIYDGDGEPVAAGFLESSGDDECLVSVPSSDGGRTVYCFHPDLPGRTAESVEPDSA